MRKLWLGLPGSSAGFFYPGQETLSLSLSWVLLASTSYWLCLTSPAKGGACPCWVRVILSIHTIKQVYVQYTYVDMQHYLMKHTLFWASNVLSLLPYFWINQRVRLFFFLSVREPEGGIKLYCKGADLVILERLQKHFPHLERIESALEVSWNCYWTSVGQYVFAVCNLYDPLVSFLSSAIWSFVCFCIFLNLFSGGVCSSHSL